MILTVCRRGNVRSVTLAIVLKDYAGYKDVFAVGTETFTQETLTTLSYAAQKIYIIADKTIYDAFLEIIPHEWMDTKWVWIDIGEDIWLKPMHPDLVEKIISYFEEIGTPLEPKNGYTKESYIRANRARQEIPV